MNIITIKQLHQLEGVLWAENIRDQITNENIMIWHAIEEVASFIELFVPLGDAAAIAPKALQVLEGGREHFEALNVPRPHAVELVLLKLARINAGLDPDAE